jgi:catechol 2,3-dioxygenase
MTTERLDLDNLAAGAGDAAYAGAPDGLRIGHIHLRVGDLVAAQDFYAGKIGLDVTSSRNGALFMSSGRYHHHVGSNIWQSAGAPRRDEDRAGLSWFTIAAHNPSASRARLALAHTPMETIDRGFEVRDPWGTRVRFAQSG